MWRACALVVVIVGSVACGNNADTDGGAPAAPASVATTDTAGVTTVPESLQFTSPLVGGGSVDGASLIGRPTVLWFWAPT